MEDAEGSAGAAEGHLKGKYYVRQYRKKRRPSRAFCLLPYITLCPT